MLLFGDEEVKANPKKNLTGNAKTMYTCIGARNFAQDERQAEDFYATEPKAVEELLKKEKFSETILEPCVGMGHIAEVLIRGGV